MLFSLLRGLPRGDGETDCGRQIAGQNGSWGLMQQCAGTLNFSHHQIYDIPGNNYTPSPHQKNPIWGHLFCTTKRLLIFLLETILWLKVSKVCRFLQDQSTLFFVCNHLISPPSCHWRYVLHLLSNIANQMLHLLEMQYKLYFFYVYRHMTCFWSQRYIKSLTPKNMFVEGSQNSSFQYNLFTCFCQETSHRLHVGFLQCRLLATLQF